ncbi:MAG TPA: DUF5713 family protein [Burkholderiales bacterium]
MPITNEKLQTYAFLAEMFGDGFFPKPLVEQGRQILIALCERIEAAPPRDLDALYALTHAATLEFNALDREFRANKSELETLARDCISLDVCFIAAAYGFDDADGEELIAPRRW